MRGECTDIRSLRRYRRTTLLMVCFGSFLGGLAIAYSRTGPWLLGTLVAAGLYLFGWRRHRGLLLFGVVLFGLSCGMGRGIVFRHGLVPYEALYGKKVTMQVTANEDAVYSKNSQLTFDAGGVRVIEPLNANLPGRVKVSGFGEYMVYRGDTVKVSGTLRRTLGGRQGQLSFAAMQVTGHDTSWINTMRRRFTAASQSALPEPAASFGLGLIIGQRSTLPDDVNKQLAAVGLTHLVAVSGYNLTIIIDVARRITRRGSKYQSVLIAVTLVVLFLLVTGFSASIVRAAIVSMLSLVAWYYGRQWRPLLLITLTAAITTAWNPLYLWGDVSWYLSFLAFFGVLVIAPAITSRIYGRREPRLLQAVLIETGSAQLMTLPYVLYTFQQVSLIAILSNLVVVPLVPVAMLVSLVAGLGGQLVPLVSGWFAWPAKILLTYILDIAALLARAPHALLHGSLSIYGLVGLYAAILAMTTVMWRKTRAKYGILTEIESEES